MSVLLIEATQAFPACWKELDENQRLELGAFVLDRTAVAIMMTASLSVTPPSWEHRFREELCSLGMTNQRRAHANIVVFDMHGESRRWRRCQANRKRLQDRRAGDLDSLQTRTLRTGC
jgi:hypothetical protein